MRTARSVESVARCPRPASRGVHDCRGRRCGSSGSRQAHCPVRLICHRPIGEGRSIAVTTPSCESQHGERASRDGADDAGRDEHAAVPSELGWLGSGRIGGIVRDDAGAAVRRTEHHPHPGDAGVADSLGGDVVVAGGRPAQRRSDPPPFDARPMRQHERPDAEARECDEAAREHEHAGGDEQVPPDRSCCASQV